jgi:hypothetical protein
MSIGREGCSALALGVVLALWAVPALACTPPPGGLPVYTIAQRVAAADVVLEGTVTQVSTITIPDDTATIQVQRFFKGSGPATVTITDFGPGAMCRSQVAVGNRFIFFARGDPATMMEANYLGQFDAVAPADPDTIAEVIAALNTTPRAYLPMVLAVEVPPPVPPTSTIVPLAGAAPAPTPSSTRIPLGELALVAGVAGAAWLWRRSSRAT